MKTTSSSGDTSAGGLLNEELKAIARRLRSEGEVPQVAFAGGDFLDVAQGVEQQELARLVASRLTERARRLLVASLRLRSLIFRGDRRRTSAEAARWLARSRTPELLE